MSLRADILGLRRDLKRLSVKGEKRLVRRYGYLPPLKRVGYYRRLRMAAGRMLRRAGLRRPATPAEVWDPGLKHSESTGGAGTLLIWAIGTDPDTLRAACRGFQRLQLILPEFVPVLITDIADFAFFSRLGWLVEYVPTLTGPAEDYAGRKQRYLAWRYRDALALPVTAGLQPDLRREELLVD